MHLFLVAKRKRSRVDSEKNQISASVGWFLLLCDIMRMSGVWFYYESYIYLAS